MITAYHLQNPKEHQQNQDLLRCLFGPKGFVLTTLSDKILNQTIKAFKEILTNSLSMKLL